jgi:hypothetical protein
MLPRAGQAISMVVAGIAIPFVCSGSKVPAWAIQPVVPLPTPGTAPLTPTVEVLGGSPEQRGRLHEAIARFVEIGLALPDLSVWLSSDIENCRGHLGAFQPQFTPWRIVICSDIGFVYSTNWRTLGNGPASTRRHEPGSCTSEI